MALATLQGANVPIKMWARPHEVESQALDQLRRIAALPWAASTWRSCPTSTWARARRSAR